MHLDLHLILPHKLLDFWKIQNIVSNVSSMQTTQNTGTHVIIIQYKQKQVYIFTTHILNATM